MAREAPGAFKAEAEKPQPGVPEFEVLPPEQPEPKHTPESLAKAVKGLFFLGALGAAAGGYGFNPECVTEEQWRELCSERAARLANKYGQKLSEWSDFYAKWEDEIWFAGEATFTVVEIGKAVYKSMKETREEATREAQDRAQAERHQMQERHRVDQDSPPSAPGRTAPAPAAPPSPPTTATPAPSSPGSSGISVSLGPARPFTPSVAWGKLDEASSSTPKET